MADLVISTGTTSTDRLSFPNDFVENPITDELLVVDTWGNRILRYAATTGPGRTAGSFRGVIPDPTLIPRIAPFVNPYGVAIDAVGNIVVADTWNHSIRVLSPTGAVELKTVPFPNNGLPYRIALAPGTILSPNSLSPAAVPTGYIYAIDGDANRVVVFDSVFAPFRTFGSSGAGPSQFLAPTGLAVDAAGRIYVSDPNNNRVQVFANPLPTPGAPASLAIICNYVSSVAPCTVKSTLAYPFGLAIDANGRLLVADSQNNRLAVFSSFANGLRPLDVSIGVPNRGLNGPAGCTPLDPGKPCLPDYDPATLPFLPDDLYPADLQGSTNIELDSKGHLLVADSSNMRVQRFVQPPITLTTIVAGGPFVYPSTITLTVTAATTEPGGLTNVTPIAVPLDLSGGLCAAASSSLLVTTTTPLTTAPATAQVLPGSPMTFTMTFKVASTASGPLVFRTGATGILANGTSTSTQTTLEAIAINPRTGVPTTTVTSTPAPNGTPIGIVGDLGWFVGQPAPVIHLTGSVGTTRIDWSTDDQTAAHAVPSSFQTVCFPSHDVTIAREGHTLLWYRSWTTDGQSEGWKKVTVHWSLGPGVDLGYAGANGNNWYNAPVAVAWTAFDNIAGLKRVAWQGSGITAGSTTVLSNSTITIPGDGTGLTATVTATNNAGLSATGTATVNIDATPPTVRGRLSGTAGTNGWYTSAVTVTFRPADALSGVQNVHYEVSDSANLVIASTDLLAAPYSVVVSNPGKNKVTFYAVDKAGNQSAITAMDVWINRTLIVTAVADSKVYDGTVASSQIPTVTGLSAGDKGTFKQTFNNPNVGSGKILTPSGTLDPANTDHYTVTFTPSANGVITAAATQTTLTASPVAAVDGQLVRFTATVTPANAMGSVTFSDGATVLGSALLTANTAVLQTTTLTVGVHVVTGTYTSATANYQGSVSSTVTVTVTVATNHPPKALPDFATVFKGDAVTIAVLANDSDPDGDTLTITSTTKPARGTITVNANGTIRYQAPHKYVGTDSFTYTISDGHGGSATATVTVTIKKHFDGDGCDHDRSRGGRDGDGSDHDNDIHNRGNNNGNSNGNSNGDNRQGTGS